MAVTVVTTDRVAGDALACACGLLGVDAVVREPRGELLAEGETLVLDLTDSDTTVGTWSALAATSSRIVALGGTPDLLPAGIVVDHWVPRDSSMATLVSVLTDEVPFARSAPSNAKSPDDPFRELTPREYQVLRELLSGDGMRVLGLRLGISEHTVRTHVQNVLAKLGVSSRAEAASYALRHGLISDSTKVSA